MKRLISCEYNFDNYCVELKFNDGSIITVDTIAVENEVADNMHQRSELDYLINDGPIAYADLVLSGAPEAYLKTVTEHNSLDQSTQSGIRVCCDSDTASFLPALFSFSFFVAESLNHITLCRFDGKGMETAPSFRVEPFP